MKYIKLFESNDLNMGDYVLFPDDYDNIRKNYPYQITSIDRDRAYLVDDNKRERNFILVDTDYKKISKKEADQMFLNNKFNI